MANPNIVNVTSIYGKTAVQAVSTTATDIITNSAGSNTVVKVESVLVSNITTSTATITASVFRGATQYRVVYAVSVPVGSTFVVVDKGTSIYLEEGDSLRLTASANTSLEAVCSYEIMA